LTPDTNTPLDATPPVGDTGCERCVEAAPAGRASDDLADQSLRALKWNYLGNAIRAVCQLTIGIVLSRLLGPEAFGTVAIAWIVVGIGLLVADLGFTAAIVQRSDLDARDIRFISTLQVCTGVLLSLAGLALADVFAAAFRRPDVAPVIRAMSAVFFVQSFGQTPQAVLYQSLDFRALQRIAITSYVVGYAVLGIPCAYLGLGAWTLVAAQLTQSAVSSVLALASSRTSLRPALRPASRGLLSFGGKVIGANLTSWSIANVDNLIVGRMLGTVALGLYSRAMALVMAPTAALTGGLQGVMFSACSRAQADRAKIGRAFLGASIVVSAISLPPFLTAATVPDTVIVGLLGGKWAAAAPVVLPLALAMPVSALTSLVGPVLTATNQVGAELRSQLLTLAVMVPLLCVAVRYSVVAVAWGTLAVYGLRLALLWASVVKRLEIGCMHALRALAWPALCGALVAIPTCTIDRLLRGLSPSPRLVADVAAASLVCLAVSRLFGRQLLGGPNCAFLLAAGRVPEPLRRWLRL
jgi:O-antigen/teichoic acid export membrane protein